MIFSNKIYKISSGNNLSLFAEDSNNLSLYIFNKQVNKKNISFDDGLKCTDLNEKQNYNMLIKLNNEHSVICFDKNISVINNE